MDDLVSDVGLATVSVISEQLYVHWTVYDQLVVLLLLVAFTSAKYFAWINPKQTVWVTFYGVIVYLLTQDLLRAAHNLIPGEDVSQLMLLLIGAWVFKSPLIQETALLQVVIYSLAVGYSQIVIETITLSRYPVVNWSMLCALAACFVWVRLQGESREPWQVLVDRLAKFVIVRWVVYIYKTFLFPSHVTLAAQLVWSFHLIAPIIVISGSPKQTRLIQDCLEAFALFFSQELYIEHGEHLNTLTFLLYLFIMWGVLKYAKTLGNGWTLISINLVQRLVTFIIIQASVPLLNSIGQTSAETWQRLAILFLVIPLSSLISN